MFLKDTHPDNVGCKCCGASARLYGACDLNKNCMELQGKFLPPSGIPVSYYRCPACGFIFSTDFDDATPEELKENIYNDGYPEVDPDYASVRPSGNTELISDVFSKYKNEISILDYGGGNGALQNGLKNIGFSDVTTFDPFHEEYAERPNGAFHLVVSFEVIEHVPTPYETFEDLMSFLDKSEGMIMFSTLVQPPDIDNVKTGWWYISPRNGHISIHTFQSLNIVLSRLGYRFASANPNLHFAYRDIPAFARHLFGGQFI